MLSCIVIVFKAPRLLSLQNNGITGYRGYQSRWSELESMWEDLPWAINNRHSFVLSRNTAPQRFRAVRLHSQDFFIWCIWPWTVRINLELSILGRTDCYVMVGMFKKTIDSSFCVRFNQAYIITWNTVTMTFYLLSLL